MLFKLYAIFRISNDSINIVTLNKLLKSFEIKSVKTIAYFEI